MLAETHDRLLNTDPAPRQHAIEVEPRSDDRLVKTQPRASKDRHFSSPEPRVVSTEPRCRDGFVGTPEPLPRVNADFHSTLETVTSTWQGPVTSTATLELSTPSQPDKDRQMKEIIQRYVHVVCS